LITAAAVVEQSRIAGDRIVALAAFARAQARDNG
jgi:hypothetical protein